MGKKIERALRQTAQSSNQDDDENKTPEPHVCNGHFMNDFTELCRRNSMIVIPPVVLRPKRPPSPSSMPAPDTKESKKGKEDKNKQLIPEPEPEPELDENGEPPEPPPKTYTTKDKFEYFKPCVQVEMDHPDKQETVTEVIVRGWKVDEPIMTIFKQCFVTLDRLHTIHLWSTGLTASNLSIMASFLPQCANIKTVIIEGNPIPEENFWELITGESPVQHLSLRHNMITNKGAKELGKQLGELNRSNVKLIALNLNNNKITDEGAIYLANGLRVNRNLLCLSLANNGIGDLGAQKLGEVLSRFPLTHEEVVARRRLISEKGSPDRQKSPPPSRRGDSKDRPGSVRSGTHAEKDKKRDKSSSKKKDDKKDEKDKTKGKKDDKNVSKKASAVTTTDLTPPTQLCSASSTGGRGSGASITADTKTKGKDKKGGKDKKAGTVVTEIEHIEISETINPLLEPVENMNGQLWIPGNRLLINLNVARNNIGETGIKALLLAVQYQITLSHIVKSAGTGLMRLCVHKNRCPPDNDAYQKLSDLMLARDPFYKPTSKSPDDDESIHS